MKRKLKGFTLIECLIALAILGIASLTMAQIYANVSRRNLANHSNNTSISNQAEFIEKELKDNGAVEIKYNQYIPDTQPSPPSGTNIATNSYIKIERADGSSFSTGTSDLSYPVDIYILRSRDADNKGSDEADYNGPDEDKTNLKYRYFMSHN